ncbi:acetyl-CoA hydrolase/transferase family protein [candidate division KSB1 bacterium]
MKRVESAADAVNPSVIPPGSRIYVGGNAATPQTLLNQLASDTDIKDVDLYSVLLLGEETIMRKLFSAAACKRITHRVIFNSAHTRDAVNSGRAKYQLWHLSEIPRNLRNHVKPNMVFVQVAGPDHGGNYSLGVTVEAVLAAIETAKDIGGTVIAEHNKRMPFVLGTTIPENVIDYMVEADYELPSSPVDPPDQKADRIGRLITELYINDGATLQFGIGEVPDAVTNTLLDKKPKDLGVHSELFSDGMRKLVEAGIVTNKIDKKEGERFSVATVFLSPTPEGYRWLHYNSSVQSRPCDYTNSILTIARQPNMVSLNSAIGIDLHGNIWADSLQARQIYSGVGGQSDFIRGVQYSEDGVAIIALKAGTEDGIAKIVDKHPEGITLTATAADPVIVVSEHGAINLRGLSIGERAVGISYLADPEQRERLLKQVYDNPAFHKPKSFLLDGKYPRRFIPYKELFGDE